MMIFSQGVTVFVNTFLHADYISSPVKVDYVKPENGTIPLVIGITLFLTGLFGIIFFYYWNKRTSRKNKNKKKKNKTET